MSFVRCHWCLGEKLGQIQLEQPRSRHTQSSMDNGQRTSLLPHPVKSPKSRNPPQNRVFASTSAREFQPARLGLAMCALEPNDRNETRECQHAVGWPPRPSSWWWTWNQSFEVAPFRTQQRSRLLDIRVTSEPEGFAESSRWLRSRATTPPVRSSSCSHPGGMPEGSTLPCHELKSSAIPSGSRAWGGVVRWCRRFAPQPPATLWHPSRMQYLFHFDTVTEATAQLQKAKSRGRQWLISMTRCHW